MAPATERALETDGPRALRDDEWGQLDHVVGTVFRPSMFQEYPQLFNRENRENLRVVADGGKVVCHVGMTVRPAALQGCRIDVSCIGAVATLDEHRGKGYASLAFQDACEHAAAQGVDVMLISGGRGLYTRVGCRQVGNDLDFSLGEAELSRLSSVRPPGGGDFVVEQIGAHRIDELSALYASEAVRFVRRREDWEMAFACGVVMNTLSHFWAVSVGGTLAAYLIAHDPAKARRRAEGEPPAVRVVEFAGVRASAIAALPRLRAHYGVERVLVHTQGSDPVLGRVLRAATGASGTPSGASGTLRVINFEQLMERCRPLLSERMGHAAAAGLTFHADAAPGQAKGGFVFRRGGAEVRVPDLASLALFLFGSHKAVEAPDAEPAGDAALLGDLRRALPLPSLWYGLSYV
jgi:predicted N-acetyltransferase YhbS